jgi:hypothetical protein
MSMKLIYKSNIEELDKPVKSFFRLEVLTKQNTTFSNGSEFVNQRKRWAGFRIPL